MTDKCRQARESKADRYVCANCGQPVHREMRGIYVRSSRMVTAHTTAEVVAADKARDARVIAKYRAMGLLKDTDR